jgi:DMSO/TMAO reductase YedYZ molybdopterin-dependent catalytic subunit
MHAQQTRRARRDDRARDERQRREMALDEALANTFPASDPVSFEQPAPPADDRDSAAPEVERISGRADLPASGLAASSRHLPLLDPAAAYGRHPLRPHQLTDRVTRTEDTIVLCHLGVPRIDPDNWSLSIDGLVRRATRLALDELMQWPRVKITGIHQCCGSPLKPEEPTRRICNVVWGGVRLSELIAEAIPEPAAQFLWASGADYGVFEGVVCDAFVKDVPLDRVAADALIAFEMNGAPLRPENGYPARLVVPGFYGTNSVKWVTRLTLADTRATGPFTTRWYNDPIRDEAGEPTGATRPVWAIAPESVIVSPAPESTFSIGDEVEVWGWAWADGGVCAVDVSADNGSGWTRASTEPPAGRAWQRFAAIWRPERRGAHELCARAQMADGSHQPASGARNAIHRVPVNVV